MKTKSLIGTFLLSISLMLTACGGPSDEKIANAQTKYTQLTTVHNQVVDAHMIVTDDSIDSKLTSLSEKVTAIKEMNLHEMSDEEIDALVVEMDATIQSYEECLASLEGIKSDEDALVLVPVPVTLINGSEHTFSMLSLYEKDTDVTDHNVLTDLDVFSPGQTLTGLLLQKNVSDTDWILSLQDAQNQVFEIILPVGTYTEDGVILTITADSEGLKATAG